MHPVSDSLQFPSLGQNTALLVMWDPTSRLGEPRENLGFSFGVCPTGAHAHEGCTALVRAGVSGHITVVGCCVQ